MATTLDIIGWVESYLSAQLPDLSVEYFPDSPADYRLNHPVGALLISYTGSKFDTTVDTEFVVQTRRLTVTVTAVVRQLNGKDGAVGVLDRLRTALIGKRPPDCSKLSIGEERFLSENAGLWQYAADFTMTTVVVEDNETDQLPLLTRVDYMEDNDGQNE